jgi:hypothetical protein
MEPRRAVRIWVRTAQRHALGATRPSVDWQSVLCLGNAFHHTSRIEQKLKFSLAMRKPLTASEVPVEGLGGILGPSVDFGFSLQGERCTEDEASQ